MPDDDGPLTDISFAGAVIEWRGPAPYRFVAIPDEHVGEIRYAALRASYGWGVVPVQATANGVDFTTSLFPRDGGYLLPLKAVVQHAARIDEGDVVSLRIRVMCRSVRR